MRKEEKYTCGGNGEQVQQFINWLIGYVISGHTN